jgi:hypothetical protein
MKYIISHIILALTTFGLIACGSAGKSSIAADDNEEIVADTSIMSTSKLIASKDMEFISHKKINLAVDINNQGGGPAYLSVYANYKESENNSWQIDHSSRILASSMESSQINHDFAIPQHLNKLLIQVWFYDGRAALSREVEISNEMTIIW